MIITDSHVEALYNRLAAANDYSLGMPKTRSFKAAAAFANHMGFVIELDEMEVEDLTYQANNTEIVAAVNVFHLIDQGTFADFGSGGFVPNQPWEGSDEQREWRG